MLQRSYNKITAWKKNLEKEQREHDWGAKTKWAVLFRYMINPWKSNFIKSFQVGAFCSSFHGEREFKKEECSVRKDREYLTVSWQKLVIQTLEQLVSELETAMSNSARTDPSNLTCEHVWVHWRPAHHSNFWRSLSHSHWNSWQFYADTIAIRLHWQIEHQLYLQILPVKRTGKRKIGVNNIWKYYQWVYTFVPKGHFVLLLFNAKIHSKSWLTDCICHKGRKI